jgi:hypothetical protein
MTRSERALLVCPESGGYLVFIDDLSAFFGIRRLRGEGLIV